MCLMQTDFPVPDGPRIIEILSSGIAMFSPRRILLRPNALWTSTNSTASGRRSGAACRCASGTRRSVRAHPHPPIGALGFAPQKTCVPSMPIRCTSTMLSTIDFAVAVPTPTGPPLAV